MATYTPTYTDVEYRPGGHAWQKFNVFTPNGWAATDRFRTIFVWVNLSGFQQTGRHTLVSDVTGSGVTDGTGSASLLSGSGPTLEDWLREGHIVVSASCTFTDQSGIKGRGIFYPPEYSDEFEDRFATLDSPQKDACWILWKLQQMMADGLLGQTGRLVFAGNSAGSAGPIWCALGCDRRGQMGIPNDFSTRPMMLVATAPQGVWWRVYDQSLEVQPGHLPQSADIDAPGALLSTVDPEVQEYASALRYGFDTSVLRWRHVVELNKHTPCYLYADKPSTTLQFGDGSVGVYTGNYVTGTETLPHTSFGSIALYHALKELNTLNSPAAADSFHSNLSSLAVITSMSNTATWVTDVAAEVDATGIDTQAQVDAGIASWGAARGATPASLADRTFQRPLVTQARALGGVVSTSGVVMRPKGQGAV